MKILGNRIFLAILVLFVAMGFYVVQKDSQNIESNLVVQAQQDNRFISIAGLRSYQSGGLIPIASTDEPAVNVSSYNLRGQGKASLYEANIDALLNFLVHNDEYEQLNKDPDLSSFRLVKEFNVEI